MQMHWPPRNMLVTTMKEWVDLWGGFEPAGWTRDIAAHVSTIDGAGANHGVVPLL